MKLITGRAIERSGAVAFSVRTFTTTIKLNTVFGHCRSTDKFFAAHSPISGRAADANAFVLMACLAGEFGMNG